MPLIVTFQRWWQQTILWLSILFLAALILVPIGLFVWLLFFTDIFTVQAITVVDARPYTGAAVREFLGDLDGKNIFLVIPETFEQRIAAQFPHVRTVYISRKLPGTIKVIVQEKTPSLLLLTGGDYFFVDSEGIVYEEARLDTLPGVVLPIVKNTDARGAHPIILGAPAVERPFVDFVHSIQEQLPPLLNFRVAEIRIPSLSAREVTFVLENNWLIRFDISRSAEQQLSVLKRLLETSMTDEEHASLEYIDLRVQNRVYYRTREPRNSVLNTK